ncbi:hypothetical protein [Paradevosia shaoguanensis]|uniref:hypothetical protein n=1 Tax=Paradevosia shaoguanensis TaxID=1335043 RepID=UPI003C75C931
MHMTLSGAFVLMLVASAVAQEPGPIDRTKLYVSKPEACEALQTKGVDAFNDLDFTTLSFTDGIQGMEFHCGFFDVKSKANTSAVLVEAICEEPGFMYPDLIAIGPWDDKTMQVISSYDLQSAAMAEASGEAIDDSENQGQPLGVALYTRCDSLSELPR